MRISELRDILTKAQIGHGDLMVELAFKETLPIGLVEVAEDQTMPEGKCLIIAPIDTDAIDAVLDTI